MHHGQLHFTQPEHAAIMPARHDHSREILAFLGILFALLAIAHSCAGCSATPPIPPEPPVVIVTPPSVPPVDMCAPGCANKQLLCGSSAGTAGCTAACEDAVSHNVAMWIYNFDGPICWATAKTPAAMLACPGISQCGDAGAATTGAAPAIAITPATPTPGTAAPVPTIVVNHADAGPDANVADAKAADSSVPDAKAVDSSVADAKTILVNVLDAKANGG